MDGANDGIITTFVAVSGVAGAQLEPWWRSGGEMLAVGAAAAAMAYGAGRFVEGLVP